MYVIKRNGNKQDVSFDKITIRIKALTYDLNEDYVDPVIIAQKVVSGVYKGISTSELDELTAETAAYMSTQHPDFSILAARISVSNLHKQTKNSFTETMTDLFNYNISGEPAPLISEKTLNITKKYTDIIEKTIDTSKDYTYDYFGFKTLMKSYLLRIDGKVVERPQYMLMRVAIGIYGEDIERVLDTYNLLSNKWYTHATPTLFNSGTNLPQLSSCFLIQMKEDSVEGIYDTLKQCAIISKYSGGIGLSIHDIRANTSYIRGTGGRGTGLVPMLKVFNDTARYINQGGKRKGSIAIYIEPWHADIFDWLELRKNHGNEENRARDLFYALWIPDLFMKRVQDDADWSLFCPNEAKGLSDIHSEEFNKLYIKYETGGKARKTIKAQKLWFAILESQIETGTPYMLYKDACNSKSNQKNLGTIKSSNLCVAPETMILTSKGYFPIKSLENESVSVWNGDEWSETIVRKTGIDQKLITINLNNEISIRCTPYHKFYIETSKRPSDKSIPEIIEACNLKLGMRIVRFETGIVEDNKEELYEAYTHGLFCADGTYHKSNHDEIKCKYKSQENMAYCIRHIDYQIDNSISDFCQCICYSKKPSITLYGNKIKLKNYISYKSEGKILSQNGIGKQTFMLDVHIEDKFFVPVNYSLNSKLRWLEGYLDGDGCIIEVNGIKNIQTCSIHKDFLQNIFYLLQTIGITSSLAKSQNEKITKLPDGKGGLKEYNCKSLYRLNIDGKSLCALINFGFSPKRLNINSCRMPIQKNNRFIRVLEIIDNDEYDDTYCFTESKKNKGVFGGILIGNCTEIIQYSSPTETAVCNLSSINLTKFVDIKTKTFDYDNLQKITQKVVRSLNKIIDINFYPTKETETSNLRHRPIGIGIQGLADIFMMLNLPFESEEAFEINKKIFETMYYGALVESNILSQEEGSYSSFEGSPASKGILQFDMWNVKPATNRYNWDELKKSIIKYGLRNSLLLAPMPTASTAQILGNNESFEPYTSNIYSRRVLSGEFAVVNKHLINELISRKMWTTDIRNSIISNGGSIQNIPEIPKDVKDVYKTVWEIKQKALIDMAADRGAYIDQSQSFNVHIESPTFSKLTSMHFYGWKKGLKTGMYYLRTRPAVNAIQFTVDQKAINDNKIKGENIIDATHIISNLVPVCMFKKDDIDDEDCLVCSS